MSLIELISSNIIQKKVCELAKQLNDDYEGREIILIGVLKGGFVFLADLIRKLNLDVKVDFISVSSYGNSRESTGVVKILKDIDITIENKHIVLVEDIVDTGLTLKHLKELFQTRNPLSIRICTMFDKPSKRKVEIDVDYKGIVIEDVFVVGYGLDYGGKYRNLPNLCTFESDP